MSNEWIKISERKPTEADLPIVGGSYRFGVWSASSVWDRLDGIDADRTHWISVPKPPQLPLPPPAEPTLEQKDGEAFRWWRNNTRDDFSPAPAFVAGLKYERSEIRQLLKRHQCGELPAPEVIREISRRVKLT